MGGDRDGDGKLAQDDEDGALTVFSSNYLSNIAHSTTMPSTVSQESGGSWSVGPRMSF